MKKISKIFLLVKNLNSKKCIENSKNCNNFHTGSKLERIIASNAKNRGFKVSKSVSPFFYFYFRPVLLYDLAASRQVKKILRSFVLNSINFP